MPDQVARQSATPVNGRGLLHPVSPCVQQPLERIAAILPASTLATPGMSRLKAALMPPKDLLARVGWLFLLVALFTFVLTSMLMSGSAAFYPPSGFAVTATMVLLLSTAIWRHARAEARKRELTIRQSERRFRSLIQNSSDVIAVMGLDTTVHYQTPSVERMLHVPAAEITGARLIDFVHPDDVPRVRTIIQEASLQPGVAAPAEWRLRQSDGPSLHVEAIVSNLLDDPDVGGLVINIRDISERKALERQMTYQALHDPLTGLANRALLVDRVERALANRNPRNKIVAVLFMDLDNFKTVNDSLGHAAGDQLLVKVSERLKASLRADDIAARLSGDEFAILLDETPQADDVVNVAQRLIEALQEPFSVHDKEVFVGASIGIAFSREEEERAEELLSNADIAMYTAKSDGKGRYAVFQPSMHAAILRRLEIEADLRRAVQGHQFVVHYQPIVDLSAGGKIIGAEALVRWMHPQRGLVPPLDFIPLAEETGLIAAIDQWVLEQACREAQKWHAQFPDQPPLTITVNVSPCLLRRSRVVAEVAGVLQATGLDPRHLCLEITESAIIQDMEATIEKLHGLKALGVQLAIDDFGTGYSSLSYLRRFPVDIIKIDRSFVTGVGEQIQDLDLTAAIVALGQTLRLRTVAEGIERCEQLDQLQKLGCELGQGYYFARPLDSDGMSMLLCCASIDGGRLA
ncbi:MAG: EAL domain-containing protein [Chloroflexota bacterium]|nr:MAG: EAL domain-containing protein [Chloroflexota bacterium]